MKISKPLFFAVTLFPVLSVFFILLGLSALEYSPIYTEAAPQNIAELTGIDKTKATVFELLRSGFILSAILCFFGWVISHLALWHRAWLIISDGKVRTTASKAVINLLIPVFNLYWIYYMVFGYVQDYNRHVSEKYRGARELSEKLFKYTSILTIACILLSLLVYGLSPWLYITDPVSPPHLISLNIFGKFLIYPLAIMMLTAVVMWTQVAVELCNGINNVTDGPHFEFPWSWLSVPSVIVVWILIAFQLPNFLLPQFWVVAFDGAQLFDASKDSNIYITLWVSIKEELFGFGAAIIVSIVLGFLAGFFKPFREYIVPLNGLFMSIPPVAWAPLMMILFGLPEQNDIVPLSIVSVIFIAAVCPMITNIIEGVLQIQGTEVKAARILGARQWQLFVYVYLPASLPFITAALRIGFSQAWRALVAAEMIGAVAGIGFMVSNMGEVGNTSLVLFGIALIGGLSWLFERLFFRPIEKRYEVWRLA